AFYVHERRHLTCAGSRVISSSPSLVLVAASPYPLLSGEIWNPSMRQDSSPIAQSNAVLRRGLRSPAQPHLSNDETNQTKRYSPLFCIPNRGESGTVFQLVKILSEMMASGGAMNASTMVMIPKTRAMTMPNCLPVSGVNNRLFCEVPSSAMIAARNATQASRTLKI